MKHLVNVTFVPGQEQAIAERMPAEQAHVGELLGRGVFEQLYVAADRSGVWVVAEGESQDDVQRTMSTLPLYPYMQLQIIPLLDLSQGTSTAAQPAETSQH
jgi:muconolactone delta-isomerase